MNVKKDCEYGGDLTLTEICGKHLMKLGRFRGRGRRTAIVKLLKKSDINIARRMVTKCREMMRILLSSKRKKLF